MTNLPGNLPEIEPKSVRNSCETPSRPCPFISEEETEEIRQKRGSYKAGQKIDQAVMDLANARRDLVEIVNNPTMNSGDILRNIARTLMHLCDSMDAIKDAKIFMKE